MPAKRSRKQSIDREWLLTDESNGEFFRRLRLIEFLSWMKKHKLRLPTGIEEAHRLVTEYLKDERIEMVKHVAATEPKP